MKYLLIILLLFSSCATCTKGIGVNYNYFTHKVERVLNNSPAQKAGIKIGDELLNLDEIRQSHEFENDEVNVVIFRKTNIKELYIKKECLYTGLREWKDWKHEH